MVSKAGGNREEKRCIAGGNGEAIINHFFTQDEMLDKARICATITLEPGVSFGAHDHTGEAEYYFGLEGEMVCTYNGVDAPFMPGDMMFTGGGNIHALRNDSSKPAKILAIVVL